MVHHLWNAPTDRLTKRLDGFFRISEKLPNDFAAMAMVDATNGADPEQTQRRSERLFSHPGFVRWSERHGAAFAEMQAA